MAARRTTINTSHGPLHLYRANAKAQVRYIFTPHPRENTRMWFVLDDEQLRDNISIRLAAPEILRFVLGDGQ